MTGGSGTEWLRRKSQPLRRHHSDGVQARPNAEEWMETLQLRPPPLFTEDVLAAKRNIHLGPVVEWHGGKVRVSPHRFGVGSGLVPWYVPEGATFDLMPVNSTLTMHLAGESAWTRNIEDELEAAALLEPYHWKADWLKQSEADDWDLPCRRPPMPGIEVDLYDEVALEERYKRMCEYKGWHYESLIPLPAEGDDDWRHAS